MAAAAVAASTAAHIFLGRHPAQFQSFVDVLLDGSLNVVQFLLSIEEVASDRIVENSFALLFEILDFLLAQRRRHLLLLLKRLTLRDEVFVLTARLFVSHKRVNPLANGSHIGLVQDRLAQFLRFLEDRSFFGQCLHNL
jgi:hypothetical protein